MWLALAACLRHLVSSLLRAVSSSWLAAWLLLSVFVLFRWNWTTDLPRSLAAPCRSWSRYLIQPPSTLAAMMLNILIAVVSDSYEHAMMKSRFIFLRSRIGRASSGVLIAVPKRAQPVVARVLRPLRRLLHVERKASDGDLFQDQWQGRALEQELRTRKMVTDSRDALTKEINMLDERISTR